MLNQSSPPISRPSSGTTSPIPSLPPPKLAFRAESTAPSDETSSVLLGTVNGEDQNTGIIQPMPEDTDVTATPVSSDGHSPVVKKTTFRRLPANRKTQGSTHSRNTSLNFTQPPWNGVQKDTRSTLVIPATSPNSLSASTPLPPPRIQQSVSNVTQASSQILPVESPSIMKATLSTAPIHEPNLNDKPLPSIHQSSRPRRLAPYRPGFQPLGVRRYLTDDFLEIRRIKRDGEGPGDLKRVERTKLERRLEKLIILNFPAKEQEEKARPVPRPLANGNRRASIFDFGSLKNMNFNDAGDLWKGIMTSNVMDSAKNDLRGS